jgi:tetratricopeptide (TPR) repeat protein
VEKVSIGGDMLKLISVWVCLTMLTMTGCSGYEKEVEEKSDLMVSALALGEYGIASVLAQQIGDLYLDHDHPRIARDCFEMSFEYAKKQGRARRSDHLELAVGKTYMAEGRYHDAHKHFLFALKFSQNSVDEIFEDDRIQSARANDLGGAYAMLGTSYRALAECMRGINDTLGACQMVARADAARKLSVEWSMLAGNPALAAMRNDDPREWNSEP